MARLKDKVTIVQEESISNVWNGIVFGDLDWPLNALCGNKNLSWCWQTHVVRVCQHQMSFLFYLFLNRPLVNSVPYTH